MIADVPLGAFLSGGIDSSAVVAAMAAGVDRAGADVLDRVRPRGVRRAAPRAAHRASSSGPCTRSSRCAPDAVEVVPKLIRHYGEPFADSSAIPSFYLAEMTRRHVTVALNGDGGDESFGGYTRYVSNALAGRLERIPLPLRRAAGALGGRIPAGGEISSPRNKARRLAAGLALDGGEPLRPLLLDVRCQRSRGALHARVRRHRRRRPEAVIRRAWDEATGADIVDRMLEVDVSTYLVDDLIAKVDIATMAHALEARSPLLDHELMELAASIPAVAEGARPGEEVDPARDAARLAPGRSPRPAQARLLGAAVELAAHRPAVLGARDPARPRRRRPRRSSGATRWRVCSTATRPAPTTTPSASGRSSCSSCGTRSSWAPGPSRQRWRHDRRRRRHRQLQQPRHAARRAWSR